MDYKIVIINQTFHFGSQKLNLAVNDCWRRLFDSFSGFEFSMLYLTVWGPTLILSDPP